MIDLLCCLLLSFFKGVEHIDFNNLWKPAMPLVLPVTIVCFCCTGEDDETNYTAVGSSVTTM